MKMAGSQRPPTINLLWVCALMMRRSECVGDRDREEGGRVCLADWSSSLVLGERVMMGEGAVRVGPDDLVADWAVKWPQSRGSRPTAWSSRLHSRGLSCPFVSSWVTPASQSRLVT